MFSSWGSDAWVCQEFLTFTLFVGFAPAIIALARYPDVREALLAFPDDDVTLVVLAGQVCLAHQLQVLLWLLWRRAVVVRAHRCSNKTVSNIQIW